MGRYREKKNSAVRRIKNMMHLKMTQSEGSAVHSEHNLSTIGPCTAILVKESLKEGPR